MFRVDGRIDISRSTASCKYVPGIVQYLTNLQYKSIVRPSTRQAVFPKLPNV